MDLGTYWVRVVFKDGRGFLMKWGTGRRFMRGKEGWSPLGAGRIDGPWADDDGVIQSILYMFREGSYSCDCNKELFIAYANQEEPPEVGCGDLLVLKSLEVLRPNSGSWEELEID